MILSEIIALPYRIGQDKYITNAVNCKKDEIKFDFNDLKKSLGNVSDYLSKHKSYIHPNSIIEKNVDIEGNVFIDEGVKIFSGVKLTGNIYIGKNSIIYNNAIVRGNTSIGDNSIIGFSTDIKNVLASSNFLVGPVCIICDSIIGSNCFFGGVCRTGNLRFDKMNPSIKVGDRLISTGVSKFGLIVGDSSQFGMAVISMPGRIVGSNCIIGSQVQIVNNIPSNKKVTLKQNLEITNIE